MSQLLTCQPACNKRCFSVVSRGERWFRSRPSGPSDSALIRSCLLTGRELRDDFWTSLLCNVNVTFQRGEGKRTRTRISAGCWVHSEADPRCMSLLASLRLTYSKVIWLHYLTCDSDTNVWSRCLTLRKLQQQVIKWNAPLPWGNFLCLTIVENIWDNLRTQLSNIQNKVWVDFQQVWLQCISSFITLNLTYSQERMRNK